VEAVLRLEDGDDEGELLVRREVSRALLEKGRARDDCKDIWVMGKGTNITSLPHSLTELLFAHVGDG
jgi:hypothetical protein